jgi:hypothetical protein
VQPPSLSTPLNKAALKAGMPHFRPAGDGTIDFKEFLAFWDAGLALQPAPLEAAAPTPSGEKAAAVNNPPAHDGPTTLAVARAGDAVYILLGEVWRSVESGVFAR